MILIRKATPGDSESIAAYLFLAMKDIIYKFIQEENPEKARMFLLHFVRYDYNQYSYQNCWVAETHGHVVGAINVYDGARLSQLRQPVVDYIREKFNQDFVPDDETSAGEYYIDTLAVSPHHQGKGIGTSLLQFVIDEHVVKKNYTLGLLVDESNPDAKRLYLKLGFKSVGRKMIFGKNMEHLQIKPDQIRNHT
jgi:ribosomal protein S18 acetylase RimI-like enzyme